MAKKKAAKAKTKPKPRARVKRVIEQAKEPFSLLNTLKEEGLSNAMMFLTMASGLATGAAKNFKVDNLRPQLKELIGSLGFSNSVELERFESRLEDLEAKVSELEFKLMKSGDSEE